MSDQTQEPDESQVGADVAPEAVDPAVPTTPSFAGADVAAQAPVEASEPAESDVDRLKRELAEAEDAQAKKTQADAIEAGSEPCPTCGANPPGTDFENPREIWCPACGAKLAILPAGH